MAYERIFSVRSLFVVILGSLVTTACMVGPDFHRPKTPETTRYTEQSLPNKTVSSAKIVGKAGKAQYYTKESLTRDWWTMFHSPELNELIKLGLRNSPTMAAAKAALREAQENLKVQIGTLYYPAFNALVFGERELEIGDPPSTPSNLFNLYSASVSVSYNFDIFGGTRRQVEAFRALVDFQCYELDAAFITLTSNIVTTAIQEASLREQIKATKQIIKINQHQLNILKKQFQLGSASESDVLAQRILLEQNEALLPTLVTQLAQARHLLAVLVGEIPSESHLPSFDLNKLELPRELPLSVPSSLTEHRPDVRASEALLHQTNALIGVATANLFPQITLSANYGYSSEFIPSLFTKKNQLWDYMGQLTQTLFQGGALLAAKRAAIAARDEAFAQYKLTVLQAFQNVADVLRALDSDAKNLESVGKAERDAKHALKIVKTQYELGAASFLSLLVAELQYQQTYLNRIQSEGRRFSDTVALFQALGGGWWDRSEKEGAI